jgi:hypothetical protein
MALSPEEAIARLEAQLRESLVALPNTFPKERAEALAAVGNPELDMACSETLTALHEQDTACEGLSKLLKSLQTQSSKRSSGSSR